MRPVDGDDTPPSAPYQEGVIRRTTSRPPTADAGIRRTTSNAKANGVASGDARDEKSELKHQFSISATPAAPSAPVDAPTQYRAAAFNAPDVDGTTKRNMLALRGEEDREFQRYIRTRTVNWVGMIAFICFIASFGFYLWVRITKTIDLGGFVWYGWVVLSVEMIGASTIILYGVNLLFNPVEMVYEEDANNPGKPTTKRPYHVRALVPCYKESLEILRRTIMALYDAHLPEGCSRTIYLLDDGKDPKKRKWVDSLGADVVYVSGRKRAPGEMNGKSGNLNNVCAQMYPKGTIVPGTELVAVFDADQVASKEFFLKTVPLFDGGDDVGMVLSPQCFHNLNLHTDIFNHSNVHFWEYMQPGYDALGFISCTGTNFLVRSAAFLEVGGSPTWTLTEDFALGMEMKKYGWHCRYVQEYLAIGEAPDQIRNCYQQRSRWCKGHFQIMFNREHCPLFQTRLSWFMRIMYMSGVWSYIVGAIATPLFIVIPIVTVWFGVFPIVVSWWAALGLTVYFVATNAVLYYVRSFKHIEALWFSNVANALLWWTYVKAFWRALNSICGQKIQFKTTVKGASMLMNSSFRDLALPGLCFFLLLASLITGVVKLFQSATIQSPLAISVLWCVYQMIPSGLVLLYACISKGVLLQYACRLGLILSFFTGACAVGLMWGLYPPNYDFAHVAKLSTFYYDAQRVGDLPATNDVSWRSDALIGQTGPDGRDMTGGWLEGGLAGNLQLTMPTAFTVSMLAWGLLAFPDGYNKAGAASEALGNIRWGADWLVKAVGEGTNATSNSSSIVYQLGNWTTDQLAYSRPEDLSIDPSIRPYYVADGVTGASDLSGSVAAALAAAALAVKDSDVGTYQTYMGMATTAYQFGKKFKGLYQNAQPITQCDADFADGTVGIVATTCESTTLQLNGSAIPLYNTTTEYDKMLWAATWLYKATGDAGYLTDANDFYLLHLYQESFGPTTLAVDWSEYFWASNVLLATLTDADTFHERSQYFMRQWICGYGQTVTYTPKGRAWNRNSGTLGGTANAAFLSLAYSKFVRQQNKYKQLQKRYTCWSRSQARYILGDSGRSLVVGYGVNPPSRVQNEAASCQPAPTVCNRVNNGLSPNPNPNVLYGALVEGSGFSDGFQDVRNVNATQVQLEYNAGFQSLLAGLAEAPGSWEQCLQGYGVLTKDKIICTGSG